MKEFKTYHPLVNFVYFVFVIGFSCFLMHPVFLGISLFSGLTGWIMTGKRKSLKSGLLFLLPMFLLSVIINPLFNHNGITILWYFESGNPLTMESIVYGFLAGAMIVSVICYFFSYNEVMTSEKTMYLFGKIIPTMSLIFSMVLRFIPRFKSQFALAMAGQKCLGKDQEGKGFFKKARRGIKVMGIMVSNVLENSVETADSMKSRGYGLPKRTAFSNFILDKRDIKVLGYITILGIYVLVGNILGKVKFECFPYIKMGEVEPYSLSIFTAYFLLGITPIIIEIFEVMKWKLLKRKI